MRKERISSDEGIRFCVSYGAITHLAFPAVAKGSGRGYNTNRTTVDFCKKLVPQFAA
jgi:hypothetical protein